MKYVPVACHMTGYVEPCKRFYVDMAWMLQERLMPAEYNLLFNNKKHEVQLFVCSRAF